MAREPHSVAVPTDTDALAIHMGKEKNEMGLRRCIGRILASERSEKQGK